MDNFSRGWSRYAAHGKKIWGGGQIPTPLDSKMCLRSSCNSTCRSNVPTIIILCHWFSVYRDT